MDNKRKRLVTNSLLQRMSMGAEPGSVLTSELTAAATLSPLAHSSDPRALVAMAGDLFGRSPRAFLIEVGAASFEFGEAHSPAVAAALPHVTAAVRDLQDAFKDSFQ